MKKSGAISVLGMDAAWTEHEPSGVAVVVQQGHRWRCRVVAPSYKAFIAACDGKRVDWRSSRFEGSEPNVEKLVNAATTAADGIRPDLIAVDMPLSHRPITARRCADDAVSKAYGGMGCGTHTPSATRPGKIADKLRTDMQEAGYLLSTKTDSSAVPVTPALIEVYPHPALLHLLNRNYRVPYKVSKAGKYWPSPVKPEQRKQNLLAEFEAIHLALGEVIDGIDLIFPPVLHVESFTQLKRYEDALDALICCWVGIQALDGKAIASGDASAAIWIPAGRDVEQKCGGPV